jgi:hypothetical protein
MKQHIKRALAHARFTIAKIPHQLMHHTLRHPRLRKQIVNLIKPFPGLDRFLRGVFVGSQQKLAQERIVFQRYSLPNLVISKHRRASPIDPADLAKTHSQPYSLEQILKNIEKELS